MDQEHDIIGMIIVAPHGTYIMDRSKKYIVKSRLFNKMVNRPLLVIQSKYALGIVYVDAIREITLDEFNKTRQLHKITEEERIEWWPAYKTLYEYHISKIYKFAAPIPIDYKTGPQVFVNIRNVKPLQHVSIGTSGYSYSWWRDFYGNSPADEKFAIYTDNFNSLEINGTFYRNFTQKTLQKLREVAPKDFVFSIKVNRSITHYYQFNKFNRFWNEHRVLKPKCLLFQFPEHFKYSDANMSRLNSLNPEIRSAFEFRDPSWFNEDTYKLFKQKKKWSVVINYHGFKWRERSELKPGFNPSLDEWPRTADFVYIRLHGTTDKYVGSHKHVHILPKLARFIRGLYDEHVTHAFVYFNNTDSIAENGMSDAVNDAKYLQKIIGF